MLQTIRVYIHYQNILEQTQQTVEATQDMQEQQGYRNNFYRSYLKSEYAAYFKGHENNRLYPKELLINFVTTDTVPQIDPQKEVDNAHTIITPSDQRKKIIKEKFSPLWE